MASKSLFINAFTIFISLHICLDSFSQGAIDGFIKSKGNADFALSFSSQFSQNYFAGKDKIAFSNTRNAVSVFGVYGITDRVNIISNIPMVNGKLQDGTLYLKTRAAYLAVKSAALSVNGAVGVSTPLTNYETESGNAIGQRATVIQPRLVAQLKTTKNWFANVRAGYNYAFDPVPSSYLYSVKWGYFRNKLYTDIWIELQTAIGGKDYRGKGELKPNSFRELGVSYAKAGGVVYYQFASRFGTFLGYGYVLNGRNTFQELNFATGLVYKFMPSNVE